MKKYIGIKVVEAKPLTLGFYNEYRGWTIPADEDPTTEGYLVKYPDGYESWCPKGQFEEHNSNMENLCFSRALYILKQGAKLTRTNWNAPGQYVYIVPAHTVENSGPQCLDVPYIKYRDYAEIKTAQGDIAKWVPSIGDTLAEDWQVI